LESSVTSICDGSEELSGEGMSESRKPSFFPSVTQDWMIDMKQGVENS
jgi:hypothetical protein